MQPSQLSQTLPQSDTIIEMTNLNSTTAPSLPNVSSSNYLQHHVTILPNTTNAQNAPIPNNVPANVNPSSCISRDTKIRVSASVGFFVASIGGVAGFVCVSPMNSPPHYCKSIGDPFDVEDRTAAIAIAIIGLVLGMVSLSLVFKKW